MPGFGFHLLWELPQSLLGLLVYLVLGARRDIRSRTAVGRRLIFETRGIGVSLGFFVFTCGNERVRRHELGHALQSAWLGPFYLIAVGLPSILRAAYAWAYARRFGREWSRYFDAYPENWADRLGGVGETDPNVDRA